MVYKQVKKTTSCIPINNPLRGSKIVLAERNICIYVFYLIFSSVLKVSKCPQIDWFIHPWQLQFSHYEVTFATLLYAQFINKLFGRLLTITYRCSPNCQIGKTFRKTSVMWKFWIIIIIISLKLFSIEMRILFW